MKILHMLLIFVLFSCGGKKIKIIVDDDGKKEIQKNNDPMEVGIDLQTKELKPGPTSPGYPVSPEPPKNSIISIEPAPAVPIDYDTPIQLFDVWSNPKTIAPKDIGCSSSIGGLQEIRLCRKAGFWPVSSSKICRPDLPEFYCTGDFLKGMSFFDENSQPVARLLGEANTDCDSKYEQISFSLMRECSEAGFDSYVQLNKCEITLLCTGDFKNHTPNFKTYYNLDGRPIEIDVAIHSAYSLEESDYLKYNEFISACESKEFQATKYFSDVPNVRTRYGGEYELFCNGKFKDYQQDLRVHFLEDGRSIEQDFNLLPIDIACPDVITEPPPIFLSQCEAAGHELDSNPFTCQGFYCTGQF